MPTLFPFRAVRYASSKVPHLDRVVTPPYDIISPAAQNALYRKSSQNFIRVLYGRIRSSDRPGQDRYSRAHTLFHEWLREGILRTDRAPGLYPYRQRFVHEGHAYDRWGLLGVIRLGDSTIFPHEDTHTAPKEDRLQLLQAVQANLSPIFGLVEDRDRRYRTALAPWAGRTAIASVMFEGVRHDLWRSTAPATIHRLQALLEAKPMLLADGHHRYEVALAYREQLRHRNGQFTSKHPANFMLIYLAAFDAQDPGILPTHRVLGGLDGWTLDRLAQEARSWLSVERVADAVAMHQAVAERVGHGDTAVGCYAGHGQWAVIAARREDPAIRLDVELLHRAIVPRCLAPDPAAAGRVTVTYWQEWREATQAVDRGQGTFAWAMHPPTLAQILRCIEGGRRLPQKSTYFIPKPLAGLVIHRLQPAGVPPRRPMPLTTLAGAI